MTTKTELNFTPDGCMRTMTGKKLDIMNPCVSQIDILDIACGLANKAHFSGQYSGYFSIAEHCMMVANYTPEAYKMVALLHDASEAYIGDMIKPLKVMLPEFQKIENRLQEVIFEAFNLNVNDIQYVKQQDKLIQKMEYDFFYNGEGELECLSPNDAMNAFLEMFSNIAHNHVKN
jgi:5'-deoxynucleotidase YfbR-like HD superfamily hydrolase